MALSLFGKRDTRKIEVSLEMCEKPTNGELAETGPSSSRANQYPLRLPSDNVAQSGFAKVVSNVVSLEEPQSQDSHRHRSQSEGCSKHRVHNIPNIRENANDYDTGR